ncbi:Pyruvate kinase [Zancudomyces culisetae]|uniref:Pyruvate kinase n=1 Tax=Zancudomyces culisetae TaxID=1213189 RepID=A0A1R1PVZ7_ZANCU|nr:Pyruvate kinase [Zancudomyces culisetae]|eukprot:OMH85150.1 Pyruvate kinase [Zancudomyces culisetae]
MGLNSRKHSNILWNANLHATNTEGVIRKSSIIGTIGPKSQPVEVMVKLINAGLNIVRMNFSHGSHEFHKQTIDNARKAAALANGNQLIAIALDTKGPEIRTGKIRPDIPEPTFEAGHEMIFSTDSKFEEIGDLEVLYIDYPNLWKVVKPGRTIYIDDGIMEFTVLETSENTVKVRAVNSGTLAERKGVNLPGSIIDLPPLSKKDEGDLKFAVENGLDMVFASFIRCADDVRHIREYLGEEGKNIKIISKIESTQGVENFDDILEVSDGIMIARGDLGIEIPAAQVFLYQKSMIAKSNILGKPVICATQMLESMTYNPRPTRAEVSDVANAIIDGADCVMLSGETAKGIYPIEAVKIMSQIAILAESSICQHSTYSDLRDIIPLPVGTTEATCSSAVNAVCELNAKLIICLSVSGTSARMLSKYRPSVPIVVLTRYPYTARNAHLSRGCYPVIYTKEKPVLTGDTAADREVWQMDVDARVQFAIDHAISRGLVSHGDLVVTVQGWRGGVGNTNTIRVLCA